MTASDNGLSDEDLLAELLWLAVGDPRRLEILGRRPDLAQRLAELEATGARLERQAGAPAAPKSEPVVEQVERWGDEDLDEGSEEFEDAALGRWERTLREVEPRAPAPSALPESRPEPSPGGSYPWRLGPVLATLAAAATLAAMVWFAGGDRPSAPEPRAPVWLTGSNPDVQAEPAGPTGSVQFFAWDLAPSPGTAQRVEVWLGAEITGTPDFVSHDLLAPRWEPGQDVRGQLQGEFRWRVVEMSLITETRPRVLFDRHCVPLSERP